MEIARFLRTLAHHRPKQLLYKAYFSLRNTFPRYLSPKIPPPPEDIRWKPLHCKAPFPPNPHVHAERIPEGVFRFLNETKDLGRKTDWNPAGAGKLWIYNLHYFDYLIPLLERDNECACGIVSHWIDENPKGTVNAWDPFPVSLRIVNWILALSSSNCRPPRKVIRSLYEQCLWLERSLEKHLLANHLFKNAKALVFGGLFFEGKDAVRWLQKGSSILEKELQEQILPDGGHFERSPMYHAMILKDCLDLLNTVKALPADEVDLLGWVRPMEENLPKMFQYLKALTHPDGGIALFNDAATGIEPDFHFLAAYGEWMCGVNFDAGGETWKAFPDSGYFVMNSGQENRLIVDCGHIGPRYQPGHGHCDALSFELSLHGRRIFVDSGTYGYEEGEMRRYNRGNRGHNTVTIDGADQSEVWGAHRCARRARPLFAELSSASDRSVTFRGAHDGYRRLPGSPTHHRRIIWNRSEIRIDDRITGRGRHRLESRLHIHPEVAVERHGEAVLLRIDGKKIMTCASLGKKPIRVEKGWYCPEFGVKKECPVLVVSSNQESLPHEGGWRFVLE